MDNPNESENGEDDNYERSIDVYNEQYMTSRIVNFLISKKEIFDKILTRKIFKIPNVFGSMIQKICEVKI